jgi:hypothetical protein
MSNEVTKRKMSPGFKIFAGFVTAVDIANAYLILTLEHGTMIFAAEVTLAVAILGYKFYKAGLEGREIEANNAQAQARYLKSLEIQEQAKTAGTFWGGQN